MSNAFSFGVFRDDEGYFVRDNAGVVTRWNSWSEARDYARSVISL